MSPIAPADSAKTKNASADAVCEQRTDTGDYSISETEVGGTSPGAIENEQLLLDEYGLGHHGTRPAGTGEPGDGRQEVKDQHDQVAHCTIVTSWRNPRMLENEESRTRCDTV